MKSILINKIIDTEKVPLELMLKEKGKMYTFLNPVSYLDALKHGELFKSFDGIFADGSLLVASIKIVYGKKITRRSCDMTSIGKLLLDLSEKDGKKLYFIASKQEEIEKAVVSFQKRYPKAIIVGYRNGYFGNEEEMDQEAMHIIKKNPDFLIVGMGIIKQEKFLLKVKSFGYEGIGFTCGGFIHQTAFNDTDYYPKWINKYNLRFIYRMWKEPYTIKRYTNAAFKFPLLFLAERFALNKQ